MIFGCHSGNDASKEDLIFWHLADDMSEETVNSKDKAWNALRNASSRAAARLDVGSDGTIDVSMVIKYDP
jgi:hypothetical protein